MKKTKSIHKMKNLSYSETEQNSEKWNHPNSEFEGKLLYTINIPQVGIVAHGLSATTDLVDWVILSYINRWERNKKAEKITKRGEKFVWINYRHLIDSLPILKIRSKDAITKRIKKLEELGLIERHQEVDNTLFLRLSDLSCSVFDFHTSVEPAVLPKVDSYPTKIGQPCPTEHGQPCRMENGQYNNITTINNLDNVSNKVESENEALDTCSKSSLSHTGVRQESCNQFPKPDLSVLSSNPGIAQRDGKAEIVKDELDSRPPTELSDSQKKEADAFLEKIAQRNKEVFGEEIYKNTNSNNDTS